MVSNSVTRFLAVGKLVLFMVRKVLSLDERGTNGGHRVAIAGELNLDIYVVSLSAKG